MSANDNGQTFPMPVQHVSVTVRVHRIAKKSGYVYYQVRYYADGELKTKCYSDPIEAEKRAKDLAKKLHEGEGRVIHLQGPDRRAYLQAKAALGPIQVPLDLAAHEYRLAHDLLAGKISLLEAVRCYAEQNVEPVDPKPVPDILRELLLVRAKDNKSKAHLKDLESRLRKFAAKFPGPLAGVTPKQIHDFLLEQEVGARTRNNFRTTVSNLIGFARLRRYVPRQYNPLPDVPPAKEIPKPVKIFSVEETILLLKHARQEILPLICLVGFGGLRTEEAARFDWAYYHNGHLHVPAEIAKPRQPRLVPVQPNLAAWLEPFRKASGPIQPFANYANEFADLSKGSGVGWKHNGLRHSFGSFRLAVTQDPQRVAYEMGNSVSMIFKHYRALVTEDEGKRYFGITPTVAPNVVALPQAPAA